MRLEGRVAIVTGAGQGIGRQTAMTFAREGAQVVVADIISESGTKVAAEINAAGGKAVFTSVDVTKEESVNDAVKQVVAQFGRIDILVNNAGVLRDARLVKMSDADFDFVINVNMKGVFHFTRAVAPIMIEQGSGVILNASSVVALYGNFGQSSYVASKSGIIGMTKVWARELGPKGIRVNAVAPGFIQTAMLAAVPEKVLAMMRQKTPLRRLDSPQDIASAYLFLASDEASTSRPKWHKRSCLQSFSLMRPLERFGHRPIEIFHEGQHFVP